MPDWLKISLLLPIYLLVAPVTGYLIRPYRRAQRVVFFLMTFCTSWHYRLVAVSPGYPEDFYRGHTRGYECTLMEVLAIMLLFAGRGSLKLRGPWIPPGLLLYFFYCLISALSLWNSPAPSLTIMAIVKFSKVALVFVAAFHFFREEKDIRFFLGTISFTLIVQAFVCLLQRYVQHRYQVHGGFEHQNSMVMYNYLLGLPLLAMGLYTRKNREMALYLSGFAAAGLSIVLSLSRGGLVSFLLGVVIVVGLTLLQRVTTRRLMILAAMLVIGAIGMLPAVDSIVNRFKGAGSTIREDPRTMMNIAARQIIADYPIVGTGWNTYGIMISPNYHYGDVYDEYARSRGHKRFTDSEYGRPIPESWYYLIGAETGLLGLTALFVFILTTLFWCLRSIWRFRNAYLGALAIGLFAGLGMNYFHSNYERVLTQPKNLAAWMIVIGLVSRLEWWGRQLRAGRNLSA